MAQRTVAVCNGKYIGIETIYTVVNGQNINIPDKLKVLRQKSQNNELFCPCGCGANLILVAGDKNLKEQHFRIKDGENTSLCHAVTEGKISIYSKINLKCWLDENLKTGDVESRVPICAIGDSSRKYEFSFVSRSKRIAVDYCYDRVNLSDEKQSILDENSEGFRIIHIVDQKNGGSEGQYPEGLMKVQSRQNYCLLLFVNDLDYSTAKMKAVFYEKDEDGFWPETEFAYGLLSEYTINAEGSIYYRDTALDELFDKAKTDFRNEVNAEIKRREEEKARYEEYLAEQKKRDEERAAEIRRRQEELEAEKQRKAQEAEEERKRQAEERAEKNRAEKEKRDANFLASRAKTERLYNILRDSIHIKGRMMSRQSNSVDKPLRFDVDIEEVTIDTSRNFITVIGNGKKGHFFVQELEEDKKDLIRSGGMYTNIDLRNVTEEQIKGYFESCGFELTIKQ